MATQNPLITQTLQTVGITAAALAAGSNFITSLYAIPAILLSPPKLQARQWLEIYNRGLVVVVPLSLGSAAIFAYLSYCLWGKPSAQGYAIASAAAFGFVPYTRILMWGTNAALQRLGSGEGTFEEATVRRLVEKWSRFNMVRGLLPFVATIVAIWVSVGKEE